MRVPELGAAIERALTNWQVNTERELRRFRVSKEDHAFLKLAPVVTAKQADDAAPRRLRSMSAEGYGRGTGRGRKDPADSLLRPLKAKGRRADFVRFIGGRGASIKSVTDQFDMTRANVNGFLTNIRRDHGIGYEKDNESVRLLLPPKALWSGIWES